MQYCINRVRGSNSRLERSILQDQMKQNHWWEISNISVTTPFRTFALAYSVMLHMGLITGYKNEFFMSFFSLLNKFF